jgi:hypothetical protein
VDLGGLSCGSPPCSLSAEKIYYFYGTAKKIDISSPYAYFANGTTGIEIVNLGLYQ